MKEVPQLPRASTFVCIVFAFVGMLLFFKSYYIVEVGHVGVIKTFGAVQDTIMREGFNLKRPFVDSIVELDTRLRKSSATAASSSRDLQNVQTQVTIQFAVNGEMAPKLHQRLGGIPALASTVIEPAIQESVKAVTAQHTAEQLVTKRAEVKKQIQKAIQLFIEETLAEKDINAALTIANVAITNFEFSRDFNQAIEAKVKAEQEALQAKNEKLRRVTQAEAAEAEQKLAADAAAYQIAKESIARAEAISREAEALKNHPELIQLRIAEKWNGALPKFNGGGVLPMLDIQNIK